jgi:hypothetical protein
MVDHNNCGQLQRTVCQVPCKYCTWIYIIPIVIKTQWVKCNGFPLVYQWEKWRSEKWRPLSRVGILSQVKLIQGRSCTSTQSQSCPSHASPAFPNAHSEPHPISTQYSLWTLCIEKIWKTQRPLIPNHAHDLWNQTLDWTGSCLGISALCHLGCSYVLSWKWWPHCLRQLHWGY